MCNGRSYFMRRAAQEQSAAANATCEEARDVHLEMARRYQRLAETGNGEPAGEATASA